MKKQIFISIIAVLSLVIFSCEKDDAETISTLVSSASMTATVGDKEWVSVTRISKFFTSTNIFSLSGTSTNGEILSLTIHGNSKGTYSTTLDSLSAQVGVVWKIDSKKFINSEGEVRITELDTSKKKISGTFSFEIFNIDSVAEQYQITSGAFTNLSYTQSESDNSNN